MMHISFWRACTRAVSILARYVFPIICALEFSPTFAQHTEQYFGDSIVYLNYQYTKNDEAWLFLQSRYRVDLPQGKKGEVNSLELHFRAPAFNEARTKVANATLLQARLNGEPYLTNQVYQQYDPKAEFHWEQETAKHELRNPKNAIKVLRFDSRHADFSAVQVLDTSGQSSNIAQLQDYVEKGKNDFHDFGCGECHAVNKNDASLKTGPNLFSLFQREARKRDIVEVNANGVPQRFSLNADASYFTRSIRKPHEQLAIGETGAFAGKTYAAIMPPYSPEILTEQHIAAIFAWLQTLNDAATQGPIVKLVPQSGATEYHPIDDPMLLLVGKRTRTQRGPLPGTSGRAIHVGTPEGLNYSFDPRILAVVKIWQGGFLNMSGEWKNRGGRGLQPGFNAQHIEFGEYNYLLAPLNSAGELIDFSFKEARFEDKETIQKSLYDEQDFNTRRASIDASFKGYRIDSSKGDAVPEFEYRIAQNTIHIAFDAKKETGEALITFRGSLKSAQSFALNPHLLQNIKISKGEIKNNIWTLPANTEKAELNAIMALSTSVWKVDTNVQEKRQPLATLEDSKATLPEGYTAESWLAPRDNFGREQLFEALGLDQSADGTIVVATRTAGIWRLIKTPTGQYEWHQFAEGTFDSLGVIAEDEKGLVLTVGQKAELTRIRDTNGDGLADHYETLFDDFSYHGNYHTYMHGPVKVADGRYYLALNLAHADDVWGAGGKYMGTFGGYSGWGFMVDEKGKAEAWVNGLRSPAGMGLGPDGRLWYTENQGEYVGTSKMFLIEKQGFYGHPAGLIDLPGRQPSSADITWDKVKQSRKPAALLFPHNKLANSPGHLTWDSTEGKFGPFKKQIFVGDQTQSNLIRVELDGDQGAVALPFAKKLSSGIMRPLFLQDGTLLLGQTGRGWQAQGGQVAALQRLSWNGTTPLEILSVNRSDSGFDLRFTRSLKDFSKAQVTIESWRYRDAPDYGSPELDLRTETILDATLAEDGLGVSISLKKQKSRKVHPDQTERVYEIKLQGEKELRAYYSAYVD